MTQLNVLFVDDEPKILRSLKAAFKFDFNVYIAQDVADAKQIIETSDQPIDVVVTDEKMQGQSGSDLVLWLSVNKPNLPAIILTGYANILEMRERLKDTPPFAIISKPWDIDQLADKIKDAQLVTKKIGSVNQKILQKKIIAFKFDTELKTNIESINATLKEKHNLIYCDDYIKLYSQISDTKLGDLLMLHSEDTTQSMHAVLNQIKEINPAIKIIILTIPSIARLFVQQDVNKSVNEMLARPISSSRLKLIIEKYS